MKAIGTQHTYSTNVLLDFEPRDSLRPFTITMFCENEKDSPHLTRQYANRGGFLRVVLEFFEGLTLIGARRLD
jgi:hypothetical protein